LHIISSLFHLLVVIRAHLHFLHLIISFLYIWKVSFGSIKIIYCNLIHCYIHYWRKRSLPIRMVWKVHLVLGKWYISWWFNAVVVAFNHTMILLLHLFKRLLKYWREHIHIRILYKWVIVSISSAFGMANIFFNMTYIEVLHLTFI